MYHYTWVVVICLRHRHIRTATKDWDKKVGPMPSHFFCFQLYTMDHFAILPCACFLVQLYTTVIFEFDVCMLIVRVRQLGAHLAYGDWRAHRGRPVKQKRQRRFLEVAGFQFFSQ